MIYLGADHRGYALKEKIKAWLLEAGYEVEDLGNSRFDENDDYPDFASLVARKIKEWSEEKSKNEAWGILLCGSGAGIDIAANRFEGVRCGLGFDEGQVKSARKDDNLNCLALAADFLDMEKAKKLIEVFLQTPYEESPEHQRRIEKIEKESCCGGCCS